MRLFLALELPGEIRGAVAEGIRRLRGEAPGWRWVPPDNIHLTLRFLGETPAGDLAVHHEAWGEAARSHGPVRFRVAGCGVFPNPRRPRILWAGIRQESSEGTLERLAATLERTARKLGFPPEDRPFRAHLTLARAGRKGTPVAPSPDSLGDLGEVVAADLVLFRSELHPSGARYEAVGRYGLGMEGGR